MINKSIKDQNLEIASFDLSNNHLTELEATIFLHLGETGSQQIEKIKASKNKIKNVSSLIKVCINLQVLDLSHNKLGGESVVKLFEYLTAQNVVPVLSNLNLADNDIRIIPSNASKLKNLQVLNLTQNKIRNMVEKTEDKKEVCYLSSLENLEELYLNQLRLKEMPCILHKFQNLRIFGSDWFPYIAEPNSLPKIVEN